MNRYLIFLVCFLLSACVDSDNYAPVTDISNIESIPKTGSYRVAKNETLYAIAWRFGLDYRFLAERNNIKPPYTIHQNQIINLREKSVARKQSRIILPSTRPSISKSVAVRDKEPNYSASGWVWPTHGEIINSFSSVNKGVNIAGRLGEPIYAAAAGKVVYSGDGLRGYGNLIIIKHNSLYLSAYAHGNSVLVKDGDWVKKGQKIAELGSTGTNKTMLHFEIRRAGKPINPLSLYRTRVG